MEVFKSAAGKTQQEMSEGSSETDTRAEQRAVKLGSADYKHSRNEADGGQFYER